MFAKYKSFFGRLGATDDGHITLQMFEENINSDSVTTYFEALGLDASQGTWEYFLFFGHYNPAETNELTLHCFAMAPSSV